jgi:hypothetical protein
MVGNVMNVELGRSSSQTRGFTDVDRWTIPRSPPGDDDCPSHTIYGLRDETNVLRHCHDS